MICRNCGDEIERGYEFCPICGIRLGSESKFFTQDVIESEMLQEPAAAEHIEEVEDQPTCELVSDKPFYEFSPAPDASEQPTLYEENRETGSIEQQPAEDKETPDALIGAGVRIRFIATIVDVVILSLLISAVAEPFELVVSMGPKMALSGSAFWVGLLVAFVYYVGMEVWLGGTVGKLLLGLKIVMADGSKLTPDAAALRTFLRVIDGIFFYFVGAVFVWISSKNQRLGDIVAGTLVVSRGS